MPDRDRKCGRLAESESHADREPSLPDSYQVLVNCRDEADQQAVYERLTAQGYVCRVLTL